MKKISVIVPCYNEEEVLELFDIEMEKIKKELSKVKFEIIYINDGSKDNTLKILRELSKKSKDNKYVSFSKNFGKEAGIYAGLRNATGDYAVVIDADLQHNPYTIIEMFNILENSEYDSVLKCFIN